MSDYWTNLAAKVGTRTDVVQPRLPARFESPAGARAEETELAQRVEPGSQPTAAPQGRAEEPAEADPRARAARLPPVRTITAQEPLPATKVPATGSVPPALVPIAPQVPVARQPQLAAAHPSRVEPKIERQGAPQPSVAFRDIAPARSQTSASPMSLTVQPPLEGAERQAETGLTAPGVRPTDTIRPNTTLSTRPGVPPVSADDGAPPTVHVTIGRVEVRAVTPPQTRQPVPPARPRFQPPMTLDAYLKRRSEHHRRDT